MADVVIYTTPYCPFCHRAKALLATKNVSYQEIDVSAPDDRAAMVQKANGQRTVPQIFIGTTHVGGSDELHDLEAQGKLDALLTGN